MSRYFQFCVILFLFKESQAKLKVTLLYESLCPSSKRFIETQLFETWKNIGQYFSIEMVPYGSALTSYKNGTWIFSCQHGPEECYGNKVQSCVLAKNTFEKSLNFIHCSEGGNPHDHKFLKKCSKKSKIKWKDIKKCLKSGKGDELLAKNGMKTNPYIHKIASLPAIILNDEYNRKNQKKAIENFQKLLCENLEPVPDPCNKLIH